MGWLLLRVWRKREIWGYSAINDSQTIKGRHSAGRKKSVVLTEVETIIHTARIGLPDKWYCMSHEFTSEIMPQQLRRKYQQRFDEHIFLYFNINEIVSKRRTFLHILRSYIILNTCNTKTQKNNLIGFSNKSKALYALLCGTQRIYIIIIIVIIINDFLLLWWYIYMLFNKLEIIYHNNGGLFCVLIFLFILFRDIIIGVYIINKGNNHTGDIHNGNLCPTV